MRPLQLVGTAILLLSLGACAASHPVRNTRIPTGLAPDVRVYAVDAGDRPIRALEAGSSLHIAAEGLQPNRLYRVTLTIDGQDSPHPVSFSRITTDRNGRLPAHILWYHSGVIGCSTRTDRNAELPDYMFRSFDEAARALVGQALIVTVQPVVQNRDETTPSSRFTVRDPVARIRIPIGERRHPMLFPSDETGCLRNSSVAGDQDFYATGRNFEPGEVVEISLVANQRAWHVADSIQDVTGVGAVASATRVRADASGGFTVRVWERAIQRSGVYDLIAQRRLDQLAHRARVSLDDIISYGSDSAYILSLRYPVAGPLMDIAGRPLASSPYFQFADSFAETDDPVWGAVDPTYVPDTHPGGRYAAYYTVDHRDVNGWDPTSGGSNSLVDVSGGPEVVPVKAGCVNGTDTVIWNSPHALGEYDVVVNFGSAPAETATDFIDDFTYDPLLDFLDGADQIGFVVAEDPYELGTFQIGRTSYSQDDFFLSLGFATDVDLRAVVRYPATVAGDNTPVAAGRHPLFVIEHGNHLTCEVNRNGDDPYDVLGTIPWSDFLALLYSYDDCPDRKPNHEGYMRLLDILASHGIIAVSIDAYDLTSCTDDGCVPQWIFERGTLILKHLEQWAHFDDPSEFPTYPDFFTGAFAGAFNNHVDMTKISVSGHSRGGEASVAAYMINDTLPTPFNIGSVSSIAPVDGLSYVLPDVPYFVILPAADGDVQSLSGVRIYDRAGSGTTPVDATTKSSIHVYGANHNFFNTIWAVDGDDSWAGRDDYIAASDQQRLGEAYLAAFSRIHLLGESVYEDMLRGQLVFPSTAGFKIYPTRHEKLHAKLDDGSLNGTAADGATASSVSGPSAHSTQAIELGWSSSAAKFTYTVPVGDRDVRAYEVFSFRASQTDSALNPAVGVQTFWVELTGGGHSQAIYTGRFDPIPKPYNRNGSTHNIMTTVRIPLHSFIMNNTDVDLTDIDTVRFLFLSPSQGQIYVDDIEFSR